MKTSDLAKKKTATALKRDFIITISLHAVNVY